MRDDLERLAVRLVNAWKSRTAIPLGERLASRAEAYAVQDRFLELSGENVIGWKVGSAARAIQIEQGHDGPIPGRMFYSHLYRSPAVIRYEDLPRSQAECEFAFRVTRDFLPGQTYDEAEIAASLVLLPAIEIAQYRTVSGSGGRPRLTYDEIADNGGAAGFVLGPEVEDWRSLELERVKIVSRINGGEPTQQQTGAKWRQPLDVAVEMINGICERGHAVLAHQFLTTGSSTVPQELARGHHLVAEFSSLGTLELRVG